MSIRYLVELFRRGDYTPELALSALGFDAEIYVFKVGNERDGQSNYWTDWGGYWDLPELNKIELIMGVNLQKVTTVAALESTENSFLIDNKRVYMNLPQKPWQYLKTETELQEFEGYSSAPKNEFNPSDAKYEDSDGNIFDYPARLIVPSLNNKLSDSISGTTLQTTFSYTLINNDGRFDNLQERNYENTITRILRSDIDNPTLDDFDIIRTGLADTFNVDGNNFKVTAADIFRTLTEPATRKFTTELYPNLPTDTQDKDLPIGWGTLIDVPLFKVDDNSFVALDPLYQVSVDEVYDENGVGDFYPYDIINNVIVLDGAAETGTYEFDAGNTATYTIDDLSNDGSDRSGIYDCEIEESLGIKFLRIRDSGDILIGSQVLTGTSVSISISGFTFEFGADTSFTVGDKFTLTFAKGDYDVDTADITALSTNRIGEIITNELESKANISYTDGIWDKTESDAYVTTSNKINFYFEGGNVKKLINEILKNDNAFFFAKNDGRLTLRQWGESYTTHNISKTAIMKIPSKNTLESKKLYMSSVSIKYNLRINDKVYTTEYFDDSEEQDLFELYRKKKTQTFEVQLQGLTEVQDLAGRLLDRFSIISEIMTIALGVNTVGINPLDKVILDVTINDRQFSSNTNWIVKEVNPGQDVLVLESE